MVSGVVIGGVAAAAVAVGVLQLVCCGWRAVVCVLWSACEVGCRWVVMDFGVAAHGITVGGVVVGGTVVGGAVVGAAMVGLLWLVLQSLHQQQHTINNAPTTTHQP